MPATADRSLFGGGLAAAGSVERAAGHVAATADRPAAREHSALSAASATPNVSSCPLRDYGPLAAPD